MTEVGEWDKITHELQDSPISKVARLNNMRADRALEQLKDPVFVTQQLGAVETDLAGIMHGGAPQDRELATQNYQTIYSRVSSLRQYLSGHPTEIGTPEIQKKLTSIIKDLKKVDNKSMDDTTDMVEKTHSRFFDLFPESKKKWSDVKKSYHNQQVGETEQAQGMTLPSNDDIQAELKRRGVQ